MIGGRQWAIKKFLRGYAVTIVTSTLLILVLAVLILARLGDLYSVRDISKINPLITSGQNELIAARDANGLTKVVKEDDAVSQSGKASNNAQKSSPSNSPDSQPQGSTTGSNENGDTPVSNTGGTGSGGTGGSAGGNTGGGSGTQPQQHTFVASIEKVGQTEAAPTISVGSCKLTHNVYAIIDGQYAPGTVMYRWKRSDGVISSQRTVSFTAGETTKTVYADPWDTSGPSNPTKQYSMTFEMISPSAKSLSVSFTHVCPFVGGL